MQILVPVDTSECSMRALDFAIDVAEAMDATVDIVHFSEFEGEETDRLKEMVGDVLADSTIDDEAEIIGDTRLSGFKVSDRIGEDIIKLVEDRDYDQVVMGHHGSGLVDGFILGSAVETVVESTSVPVTVVP